MSKQLRTLITVIVFVLISLFAATSGFCAEEYLSFADLSDHPALMETDNSGNFYPDKKVTRVQVCKALAALFDMPTDNIALSDLKVWDDGYRAVANLYGSGILDLTAGDSFRPDDLITRLETADILFSVSKHTRPFTAERIALLSSSVADASDGWDGEYISRGELAYILVSLSGREPSEAAVLLSGVLPADVTDKTDGWIYIGDSLISGTVELPEPGPFRACGWLYFLSDDGSVTKDTDTGVWTFGLSGAYTTGNETLDTYLRDILEDSGANGMDTRDALKAVYLYIKDNYEYRISPEEMETIPENTTGWEYARALLFFENGGGTCYSYAAAFGLLARCLGYEAYIISAEVNQYYAPHGFVVIPENGVDYIYDVEMEDTRPERHGDLDLFAIRNKTIYYYWYESQW